MPTAALGFHRRDLKCLLALFWLGLLFATHIALAASDVCFVCQKEIRSGVYTHEDRVTHTKRFICSNCLELTDTCYLCSLPVLRDFTRLPDGRVICNRDVKAVVLDDKEAAAICEQVKYDLDRLVVRFLTIPESNVTVQLMDRVKLQELYKIIGNDFSCPNTLGCTEIKTNAGKRSFLISILSGQPREDLMTTCVHEYAHTWVSENVPAARQKTIGKDAVEGFCELLSYLFAEQQGLSVGKSNILANHYTRGQIQLFLAAYQQYGLADVTDWMKHGEDRLLLKEDLNRIHRLVDFAKPMIAPAATDRKALSKPPSAAKPKLPEQLILQGIVWSAASPMATINGHNFSVNDEIKLTLAAGVVTVRCLEINPAMVVLETNHAPEKLTLRLR